MSTSLDFIEFTCDQIAGCGIIRYRKMFGEYMVYVNDKPVLLVCDNTVYVKKHDALEQKMHRSELGIPYKGSKEHYILDIDDSEFSKEVIAILEPITSIPKKKSRSLKNPIKFKLKNLEED